MGLATSVAGPIWYVKESDYDSEPQRSHNQCTPMEHQAMLHVRRTDEVQLRAPTSHPKHSICTTKDHIDGSYA